MTQEIKWMRGNFLKFIAQMKIRIGGVTIPLEIHEGDEFEYDGSVLRYAGAEHATAGVRGAIRNGWAVLDGNEPEHVESIHASRNIAAAKSINRDLSRVQRGGGGRVETTSLDEETVLDVQDRRPGSSSNPNARPAVMTQANNKKLAGTRVMGVVNAEDQGGEVIAKVRTAARVKHDVTRSDTQDLVQSLDGAGGQPVYNRTVHREGVAIKMSVGQVASAIGMSQEDEGVTIGQIRRSAKQSTEGIEVLDTSNSNRMPSRSAAARPAAVSVPSRPAAPPVRVDSEKYKVDVKVSPKVRVARAIDPTFPADWSFQGKLAERLEAVKAHGASPRFLEALYAAEGDQMRKKLEETFPKQFAG